jgi:thiol:disulfide interchange protein DsbD
MAKCVDKILRQIFCLLVLSLGGAYASDSADLLPVEEAYRLAVDANQADEARISWDIADGYYLYRDKIRFVSRTPGIRLGNPVFPAATAKTPEDLSPSGPAEIYRGRVDVIIPLLRENPKAGTLALEVKSQGCADAGACYPPQTRTVDVPLLADEHGKNEPDVFTKLARAFRSETANPFQNQLLPADQAFQFFAEVKDADTVEVSWRIAEGYYLYREKFALSVPDASSVKLGSYAVPRGETKEDEAFGTVEVFYDRLSFDVPLVRTQKQPVTLALDARYQGCAERGVCYPPIQKVVTLELPASAGGLPGQQAHRGDVRAAPMSEQDRIARALNERSFWLTLLSFLGSGLLLAFTPCIFPMIPILSGIIVGQGAGVTTRRAFLLSLSYVLAAALAYTVFGVLAAVFGSNLQAALQEPWVIGSFSAVFVLLALSMFGIYQLQMPGFIQSRIAEISRKTRGGTITGAAAMGFLSALIVGPCVAAPLAGALIYIGQTGDVLLGGLALFALGLGMGIPLLLIGASAGKLVPKAGMWMNAVRAVFGVGLLAVAIWLVERIVPTAVGMLLWAMLLIIPAIYLSALDALPVQASGWRKLWKGLGIAMLTYGILLLVGVASNSQDPLQPLRALAVVNGNEPERPVARFEIVRNVDDLQKQLASASAKRQWVMLDFYADWCISCKEMERYTFSDPDVRTALSHAVWLQADVTENTAEDAALLRHFGLLGPPAVLFFGPDQTERKAYRIVGDMRADRFLQHVQQIFN